MLVAMPNQFFGSKFAIRQNQSSCPSSVRAYFFFGVIVDIDFWRVIVIADRESFQPWHSLLAFYEAHVDALDLRVPGLTALGQVCFIFLEKRGGSSLSLSV